MFVLSKIRAESHIILFLFLQLQLILSHPRCHNTKNMDFSLLMFVLAELCGLSTYLSLSKSKTRNIEFYARARKNICWNLIMGASPRLVNSIQWSFSQFQSIYIAQPWGRIWSGPSCIYIRHFLTSSTIALHSTFI